MKKLAALSLIAFALFLLPVPSFACTTFCLKNKGEVLFGKNYDWMIGDGLVFVNKRGVTKQSTASKNAAKWTAKYGSVTFNQYGWENPSGGMNEAGLAIELMWLDDTKYPELDGNPTLDVLEFIQYSLDSFATTEEMIKATADLRIESRVTIHFLVNDKNGNSATIEFLNGKLTPHYGEKLQVAALANDTYERSLEFSKKNSAPQGKGSLQRFTRAAEKAKEFENQERSEKESIDYAFDTLKNVEQPGYTQWSIVYDQKRAKIHFRTLQSPQIKTIDAKALDYTCGSAVKILDINSKTDGDVTAQFKDFTKAANRDLIERSFTGTPFLKNVPAIAKDGLASYPEKFGCGVIKEVKNEIKTGSPTSYSDGKMSMLEMVFPPYYIYKRIASYS